MCSRPAIGLLIGAAIWIILFTMILEVLKKASLFSGWPRHAIAVCTSLHSVIGIHRLLAPQGCLTPPSTHEENPFGFLLLPYAATGISILVVLLFVFLQKLGRTRREMPWEAERS